MTRTFSPTHAGSLSRSTPEAQGIASSAIGAFLDAVVRDGQELHSVMILRRGAVVAEGWWSPYGPEHPHMLYSLSKSFTATAAGLAIAEGKLSLDDRVVSFFPDDVPSEISANLAAMRVRDLLSMSSGHNEEPPIRHNPTENWARAFLAHPVTHEPGTHFVYSSSATYMISAIVQKTTGQDLLEYLGPRLFAPLGIVDPTWERCPRGIPVGGWGLSIRTEDIAAFGELYRNDGVWNGERLLPAGWVATATAKHVSNGNDPGNDWNQGYGFQFWRCRHGAYRGDGAFGQYCVVLPEQEAVVAITSRVNDMGAV
ncbi:MAG: serine hydrolase, partial [Akkermansiaceae bacterium]|nr:serine hydrolase [Armatimonadota bacterium]